MFPLLKTIRPTWYYNLQTSSNKSLHWVDFRKLSNDIIKDLDFSNNYDDEKVAVFDASLQLWHKGYITDSEDKVLLQKEKYFPKSLKDQYTFVRRFHKPIWVFIAFLIRVIFLNNPIKEFIAYFYSRNQNVLTSNNIYPNKQYDSFNSQLVIDSPFITIIIPTLNRYEDLNNALLDLEKQTYSNFEIVVVDQSDNFSNSFYKRFKLKINLIRQKEKALWRARNKAIKESNGEYILLFDDDSRVSPNWIEEHLKCIDFFKTKISAGVSISEIGAPVPRHYSFFRWSDQFDTGNAMIKNDCKVSISRLGVGKYMFGLR